MAVGDGQTVAPLSYITFGRETTLGTFVTGTAGLPFISASLKTTKETKILEQIQTSRTYSKEFKMGKTIEGDIEYYFRPRGNADNHILQQVFGGTVTSATATGETTSGLAFTHTYEVGNMDQSYTSLSINMRKGDSLTGKRFEYSGLRVNELTISGEMDEALKMSASFIGLDSSSTTSDLASTTAFETAPCLDFSNGRVSVELLFASLTSTSFFHVQSFEFGINNSLKSDTASRRIGTDLLTVLPPGIQSYTFTVTMRFDTTTAFDGMIANTNFAAQIEYLGDTLPTSTIRQGIRINLPKLRIMDAGDPEVGGPDELLTSEVTFAVLRDDSSATGFAIQTEVTNVTSSYA